LKLLKWAIFQQIIKLLAGFAPKTASKLLYRVFLKKRLNLDNPQTLNEKIMWLKLNTYKNNEKVTTCIDKAEVDNYLVKLGLESLIVPKYFVVDKPHKLNFAALPNKFVLKCNHGCGFNIICTDKTNFNEETAKSQLQKWLKTPFWRTLAEINYRHIKPKILCEKYLEDSNGNSPNDYKVYCFSGKATHILVCTNRNQNDKPQFYFFNTDWQLDRINKDSIAAPPNFTLSQPANLPQMLQAAETLSSPFPFVRVDFYVVDEKLYFGEMTFTPSAGLDADRLPSTDLMFGKMLELPK